MSDRYGREGDFNSRYEASRRVPSGCKPVKVVGTYLEFRSIADCARYFEVSQYTILRVLKDGPRRGELALEWMEK